MKQLCVKLVYLQGLVITTLGLHKMLLSSLFVRTARLIVRLIES